MRKHSHFKRRITFMFAVICLFAFIGYGLATLAMMMRGVTALIWGDITFDFGMFAGLIAATAFSYCGVYLFGSEWKDIKDNVNY